MSTAVTASSAASSSKTSASGKHHHQTVPSALKKGGSRQQQQSNRASIVVETTETVTSVERNSRLSKGFGGTNIQFVHYTGDTHFEPYKLADVKLPSLDGKDALEAHRHEPVLRLDLLDIKSDEVYEKLTAIGSRLHGLAIRDLSLNYVPKDLIPIWPNISSLDLSGNSLNEFSLSDTMLHLVNLQELNLNGNSMQQLPKNFKGLKQLRRLFLSRNRLISLTNLDAPHLQWFVVDGNSISNLETFLGSSNCEKTLQVLDVSKNEITALPSSIRNFRSLVDLDLSSNNIRVLPIELFKLPSLHFFNASCNRISHVPSFSTQTSSFSRSQLRAVDLSENVLSKLPEHLLFLADKVDVSNNSIKFIRGNLLQKITFSSKKQLAIDGNPLIFPPANLVAKDGLRGLLSFFSTIKNKVKRRQGIKVFVTGRQHNGKTSFVKSLVDEFPHIADEATMLVNYDEFFVDIDAPGELGHLLANSQDNPSVPTTPGLPEPAEVPAPVVENHHILFGPGHSPDGSCCSGPFPKKGLPREFTNVKKRVKKPKDKDPEEKEALLVAAPLKQTDPASLWKCVQLPVLDVSGRGIFAALRKYFLEDNSIYMIVFNLSAYPSFLSPSSPVINEWYRDNIGIFLDEIFALCKEAYVILVGSFVDKVADATEIEIKCNAVLSLAAAHRQKRLDVLTEQLKIIEQKPSMTMSDQEQLLMLKNLLDKQKIRIGDKVVTFSSQVEGNYSAATLATLIQLLQSGTGDKDSNVDPFFKQALEPITNLHSDIIEYIELLATSMRFPIVDSPTFEDIFFKEYQIISEQIVKRIPKFLHLTGHIFWSDLDVLSDLVVLRPEFITEFLSALFAFIFDEKPVQASMVNMQEAGRKLYQLGSGEVREGTMRFVKTGILNTIIGELMVRKALNIRANESLQTTMAGTPVGNRAGSSISESDSIGLGDKDEGLPKQNEAISSAPIHLCVEKFSVGFQMAYVFDSDSLEYQTLMNPRIVDIDMRNPRIAEQPPAEGGKSISKLAISTASALNELKNAKDEPEDSIKLMSDKEAKDKKIVSFAAAAFKKHGNPKGLTLDSLEQVSGTPPNERVSSPVKRSQSPTKSPPVASNFEEKGFFLKFPKNAKIVRQIITSSSGTSISGPSGGVGGRSESKSSFLGPGGRAPSNAASAAAANNFRYLLFPALRPATLPEAYRLAMADAWECLSPDMWIGASLTFPSNFYPPSAFHEMVARIRRKVQYLEFGYVWQKGAFGKFMNSTSCFVKILHQHATPLECDFESVIPPGTVSSSNGRNENTITFEIRTDADVPSPESAKLNMVAGFLFNEKTLRDYVMNLWERMYEMLAVVEEYCGSFAALLLERRVRCPYCGRLAFIGEWKSPRELQAFPERTCPICDKSVDTAYLVQPKSCQRELCERIMKDIQKRRASNLLAHTALVETAEPDSDSDEDGAFSRQLRSANGGSDEALQHNWQQVRQARRNITRPADPGSASSTSSSRSKKSSRLMADHKELLSMM